MSDTENPYASPQAESVPENTLLTQASLTDTMLGYLKEASPWLRFIGIVGYICCGLIAVAGIATIAFMGALTSLWEEAISELGDFGNIFSAAFSGSMGFNFLITAVLYYFPSRFIYNFGVKLRSYLQNGREQELELALKNNKSLWKFLGILLIITLSFIPLLIVGVIIAVVVAVLANGNI